MSRLRVIIQGSRPLTWALSLCPVLIAALSAHLDVWAGTVHAVSPRFGLYLFLCCLVALSLQICANFVNDYLDGVRGIDIARNPYAPVRANHFENGTTVSRWSALVSAILGIGAGVAVIALSKQYWLLLIGALCLAAVWVYSAWLSALGLGELLAFIFFGPVVVWSCVWILAGFVGANTILAGVQTGAIAAAVLLVNNLRDRNTDAAVGKKTLIVRVGQERGIQLYYWLLSVTRCIVIVQIATFLFAKAWRVPAWVILCAVVLLIMSVWAVTWEGESLKIAQINAHLYRRVFISTNIHMILLLFAYVVMLLVSNPS